jgi:hypothetical protein
MEGYGFMVRQTTEDLSVGVQLVQGVMQSSSGPGTFAGLISLINYYNYQVLPGTFELILAQESGDQMEYLTQLKFRSDCKDYRCHNNTDFLRGALKPNVSKSIFDYTEDYRPDPVVAAAASVPESASGRKGIAMGLKRDRDELQKSWEGRVTRNASLFALLIWVGVIAIVGAGVVWLVKRLQTEMAIAVEIADKIGKRQWDQLDEVLAKAPCNKSTFLQSIEQIVGHLKVYRAYMPDELFVPDRDIPGIREEAVVDSNAESRPPQVVRASSREALKVNKIHALDPTAAHPAQAIPADVVVPVACLAAPPKPPTLAKLSEVGVTLRPVTMLCLKVFNFNTIRNQKGSDVACRMHSDLTNSVQKAAQASSGLLHQFSFHHHKWFVSWNAVGNTTEKPQDKALQAALEIQHAIQTLNSNWQTEHAALLTYGVAVTSGNVTVGNWGSESSRQFGIMGDAFTILEPLAALNQVLRSSIVLDEATQHACSEHFVIRIVDMVDFEASSMQINPSDYQVYELLTEDQSNRPRPQWLQAHTDPKGAFEHFQAALKQLQNGDTSAALRSMQTHIDANPADDVATQRLLSLKQQSSAQNPGRRTVRQYHDNWELSKEAKELSVEFSKQAAPTPVQLSSP